jgi:hypothetical protein
MARAAAGSDCTCLARLPMSAAYGVFGCANEALQYRALRGPGMTLWRVFSGALRGPVRYWGRNASGHSGADCTGLARLLSAEDTAAAAAGYRATSFSSASRYGRCRAYARADDSLARYFRRFIRALRVLCGTGGGATSQSGADCTVLDRLPMSADGHARGRGCCIAATAQRVSAVPRRRTVSGITWRNHSVT